MTGTGLPYHSIVELTVGRRVTDDILHLVGRQGDRVIRTRTTEDIRRFLDETAGIGFIGFITNKKTVLTNFFPALGIFPFLSKLAIVLVTILPQILPWGECGLLPTVLITRRI